MTEPDSTAAERWDTAKTIMLVGFSTAIGCALFIVIAWAVVLLKGWPMPESLDKMSFAAFTFLTTMASFGRDFVNKITGVT